MCRNGIRKAKAQLELKPVRDVKCKKGFCNYNGRKGRLRKTVGPLLIGAGNLMTEDMGNAEVLNFSVSIFHWQVSLLSS